MKQVLTTIERSLLERYYDGELVDKEVAEAQALLNRSQEARVFMAALEELTLAVQVAEETAWQRADAPSGDSLVAAALEAASLAQAPISELAPLLERFYDGEVVPEEMATVSALLEEREDVADYLANLEGLGAGIKATTEDAVAGVSFDGFWDSIESRIGEEEDESVSGFDPEEHRVLLYRYHDDEASAHERTQVEGWLAAGEPEVLETLAALDEVRLATVVSIETAQERADLSGLWHAVEEAIDDQIESQGENVVSFERKKRKKQTFFSRQGALVAAAAIVLVTFSALLGEQLLGPKERVIVEKTVVIVDSVEYQPGSSVMVNSPMQPVSAEINADDGQAVDEEPTVIWLLDTGDETEAVDGKESDDAPAEENETEEETAEQPI
jgi:hypothetical protein